MIEQTEISSPEGSSQIPEQLKDLLEKEFQDRDTTADDYYRASSNWKKLQFVFDNDTPSTFCETCLDQLEGLQGEHSIDDLVTLTYQVIGAYQRATALRQETLATESTAPLYTLPDFLAEPFTFLDEAKYGWLAEIPPQLNEVVKVLAISGEMITAEWKLFGLVPEQINGLFDRFEVTDYQEELPVLLDLTQHIMTENQPYGFSKDIYEVMSESLLAFPDQAMDIVAWWQVVSTEGISPPYLDGVETNIVELVFHRFLIVLIMSGKESSAYKTVNQLVAGSKEKSIADFFQIDGAKETPVGFKLHLRGAWQQQNREPVDPTFYSFLHLVKQFAEHFNLGWKCRLPRGIGTFRALTTEIGSMVTLWPPAAEGEQYPFDLADWQRQWQEMLQLARQFDELFARAQVGVVTSEMPRAKTDWLVESEQLEESSSRVQIRFGENTTDPDEIVEVMGNDNWQDNRRLSFEENLPIFLSPEQLREWATEVGVILQS